MAHDRRFRFGVSASSTGSGSEWRETARRAEGLGYSTLFVSDHFVNVALAPVAALSCAAEATTTLRVGPLVLGNDYRHPVVVAKEAATLDLLSDGRVELGLGAGWMTADYEELGLPMDSEGTRIERLGEALEVVKRCFAGEAFDFEGKHYRIAGHTPTPRPVQSPRPPIIVGGGGPRLLALAGREADIVGINVNFRGGALGPEAIMSTASDLTDQKVAWLRVGAGDRFEELELQLRYFVAAITNDAAALAERLAPNFGVDPTKALDLAVVLAGTVDEVCDLLVERRERWGVSYSVIGPESMDAFAPVVARLAGT